LAGLSEQHEEDTKMAGALDGYLILDWTQFQLGPGGTTILADMGANVIKIEMREVGDGGRGWVRPDDSDALPPFSSYFETNNRGKKSITVDLTTKRGRELVHRLVEKADAFVHNVRQGIPEKLGMDYETLREINPKIVYVAGSGYGPKGPEGAEPSFDYIGQARSGMMNMVGEPEMPPLPTQGGASDQMAATMIALGTITALLARERQGIGQRVDVSHLGSMMALLRLPIGMMLFNNEEEMLVRVNRKQEWNPLWNRYLCKDGKWVVLGMLQPDKRWPTVCKALGIEHLENDPKFVDQLQRGVNCEELIAIMDEIFLTKTVDEWMKHMKETGDIICCPIQTLSDLIGDPQVVANEYIVEAEHRVLGKVKVPGKLIQFSETPGEINADAPELGQHTEEVLIEIGGYDWEDIAQLQEEGVI